MKTRFNNKHLCHVWAQQTQSHGRGNNMFFEGTDIYSYGHHYLAARIHTVKGKRVALRNSNRYSVTTQKHLGYIFSALYSLMPVYDSSDVTSLKVASSEADSRAKATLESSLKRVKVTSRDDIGYDLATIKRVYKEASELRALIGKRPIAPSRKDMAKVKAHLEKRLKRYQELNTPEMMAERARKANEKAEHINADRIGAFRAGLVSTVSDIPYELLRIRKDMVVTSRGAEVPLDAALILYRAIKTGRDVLGARVGNFSVVKVTDLGADKAIKIGCHEILLSEAENLFRLKEVA